MASKVFTSIFCIFVAAFMFQVNQIGGAILSSNVALLIDMGAASGDRMAAYMDAPLIVGGSVQTLFVLFILVFQLAMVWTKD
tara:strand:- start:325 stop:570 length:246 start_codon:yes stop_codon:yes gene_type:complete